MTRKERKRLLRKQRRMGIVLLLCSAFILWFSLSEYGEQEDRLCLVATVPTGIYLLVGKHLIIE